MKTMLAALLVAGALVNPPAGRPPVGPLQRHDPKVYDIKFQVTLSTDIPHDPQFYQSPNGEYFRDIVGGTFRLQDTPIVMPLIFNGAYSQIDQRTLKYELWLQNYQDRTIGERARVDSGYPFNMHAAVMPIVQFQGKTIRWNITYKMQSFSAKIDEHSAAQIPWPREWPDEVATALQPQLYIESDQPIFGQAVEHVAQGRLRMVPPYLAAKELVRYCIKEIQVSGDELYNGRMGVMHGLDVSGAKKTADENRGRPCDLVCVCVAILRAAGIPARPVIGMMENEKGRDTLVVWAEFYLPDAGWVPFDPNEMRGSGVVNRDVRQAWSDFGTMKDLNDRIPLSYAFLPKTGLQAPMAPAVWGWDPRPSGAPACEQRLDLDIISRGRGTDDPR